MRLQQPAHSRTPLQLLRLLLLPFALTLPLNSGVVFWFDNTVFLDEEERKKRMKRSGSRIKGVENEKNGLSQLFCRSLTFYTRKKCSKIYNSITNGKSRHSKLFYVENYTEQRYKYFRCNWIDWWFWNTLDWKEAFLSVDTNIILLFNTNFKSKLLIFFFWILWYG